MTLKRVPGGAINPVSTYAKAALVLLVVSFAAGGFEEAYVPSKLIVWSDAAATMRNIKTSDTLFRLAFIAYLIEATCDVALLRVLAGSGQTLQDGSGHLS